MVGIVLRRRQNGAPGFDLGRGEVYVPLGSGEYDELLRRYAVRLGAPVDDDDVDDSSFLARRRQRMVRPPRFGRSRPAGVGGSRGGLPALPRVWR